MQDACVSCRTVAGVVRPPGGIVYDSAHWIVFLRTRPLLIPGQGFIVLKRHCEDVAELTPEEAAALGVVMQRVAAAYAGTLAPERVHFGLYGEGVRHIHLHVMPRVSGLPPGNIPLTLLEQWYVLLARLGVRRGASDEAVSQVAERLRDAFGPEEL